MNASKSGRRADLAELDLALIDEKLHRKADALVAAERDIAMRARVEAELLADEIVLAKVQARANAKAERVKADARAFLRQLETDAKADVLRAEFKRDVVETKKVLATPRPRSRTAVESVLGTA